MRFISVKNIYFRSYVSNCAAAGSNYIYQCYKCQLDALMTCFSIILECYNEHFNDQKWS